MGAFLQMKNLYPDLIQRAKELDYPASSICILEGNEIRLRESFPEAYNNLLSCRHNRDARTPIKYGQDLVASWLFEDMLMLDLKQAGIDIQKAGADKNREVLSSQKVSSSSDCLIRYKDKEILLELMCDYTGYWAKTHRMDLRDSKFEKMRDSQSLFLGVSLIDNTYILLDFTKEIEAKYIQSHWPYGGKPAYSVKLSQEQFHQLSFESISFDIKSCCYDRF